MFEKKEVALPGGPLSYYVGGQGRPILYFHSAGGVRLTRGLELLAARHRIYVPVIPGFDGTPPHPAVATMPGLADLGAAFADAVIGERCDVMGQSFGGWIAPWFALRHPGCTGQLVLQCPAGFRAADAPPMSTDPAVVLREMYAHPERRPAEDKTPETLAANRRMLHHYHGAAARDEALIARLAEIEALTLILLGTRDGRVRADSVRLVKRAIPHSFLVYIFDAAHNIEVDQPARLAQVVGDFLGRAEAFLVNWNSVAGTG